MFSQSNNLGTCLACLEAEKKFGKFPESLKLTESEKEQIQIVKKQLNEAHRSSLRKEQEHLPDYPCQTENPLLAENINLFLKLLSMEHEREGMDTSFCSELSKHLNSCYRCFQSFCMIMRSYYHTLQTISEQSGKKNERKK